MTKQILDPQLSPELLLNAYSVGYFPMAEDYHSRDIVWVKPDQRGVIPLEGFRASRSLRKAVRQERVAVRVNTAFRQVMEGCAMPQTDRYTTWINPAIISAYTELHRRGLAHSVEAWQDGQLVGGLYGVSLGGAFFGESMFSTVTDASKICLCHLVARLKVGGYRLLDTQFQNDHLVQFGTVEVPADAYELMLSDAIVRTADWRAIGDQPSGSTILQSITHTS